MNGGRSAGKPAREAGRAGLTEGLPGDRQQGTPRLEVRPLVPRMGCELGDPLGKAPISQGNLSREGQLQWHLLESWL